MKNTYFVEDAKILEVTYKKYGPRNSKTLFALLEDGREIPINGHLIKIQCVECKQMFSKKFNIQCERREYLCHRCSITGDRNGFFGKKHKSEFKDRLSRERKGTWCVGEKNAMYGKPCFYKMSEEEKETWLKNSREAWKKKYGEGGESRKELHDKMSAANKRSMRADPEKYRQNKAKAGRACAILPAKYKMNGIELAVDRWLTDHGIEHNYSAIMGDDNKNFQFDFIVRHRRILIEVQGDYWHGNPKMFIVDGSDGKEMLNETQKIDIARDTLKRVFAEKHNFKLLYIWENDIKNNDFSALEELINDENNIS